MRLDRLQVELRPRSPWEAMELGSALVRRNAGTLWRAWLLASLPVFVLFNLVAWALDAMLFAALAMWWLKPARTESPVWSRARCSASPAVREAHGSRGARRMRCCAI